ncbi:hypothetical protein BU16DRAFT_564350 [Lophium mytilinum]|uniref:Peptidase A2 domain-containing protein n=1 Tax=Lophium mytilinum TaxID=390894 RepID=A0A6A6QLP9_9PEZI|nr:hypothetical protein BU16DRAFT_564350 [Lophium mytilinum]
MTALHSSTTLDSTDAVLELRYNELIGEYLAVNFAHGNNSKQIEPEQRPGPLVRSDDPLLQRWAKPLWDKTGSIQGNIRRYREWQDSCFNPQFSRNSYSYLGSTWETDIAKLSRRQPLQGHYRIEGTLNNNPVSAFPDTGAAKNVISLNYCERLGISVEKSSRLSFQLPHGRIVHSTGKTRLRWRFADESKYITADFHVVPSCTHNVILGNSFLTLTKSLTKFFHRIKTSWLPTPQRLGVQLLGFQRQRVFGYLNGNHVDAIPDTGSDVLLISRAFAKKHGYQVQKSLRSELEFGDGSRTFTDGMVTDLEWNYGDPGTSYTRDFHVLENLPADLILSNDFLFGTDAFRKNKDCFYDIDGPGATQNHEFSLIKNIGWLSDRISSLLSRTSSKVSQGSITIRSEDDEIRRELQRRDEADEAIAALPGEQQRLAQDAETLRRTTWTPETLAPSNPSIPSPNTSKRQNEWSIRIFRGAKGRHKFLQPRDTRQSPSRTPVS